MAVRPADSNPSLKSLGSTAAKVDVEGMMKLFRNRSETEVNSALEVSTTRMRELATAQSTSTDPVLRDKARVTLALLDKGALPGGAANLTFKVGGDKGWVPA